MSSEGRLRGLLTEYDEFTEVDLVADVFTLSRRHRSQLGDSLYFALCYNFSSAFSFSLFLCKSPPLPISWSGIYLCFYYYYFLDYLYSSLQECFIFQNMMEQREALPFLEIPFLHCIFTSILQYPSRCSSSRTSSFQISPAKHRLTLLWTQLAWPIMLTTWKSLKMLLKNNVQEPPGIRIN